MSVADLKRSARAGIHGALAEPCVYHDRTLGAIPSVEQSAEGLVLSARFKSKLRTTNAETDGVNILESIESLIFNQDQLTALGIDLEYATLIEFPGFGITFRLDQEMDRDGPINVYWTVTRE